MQKIVWAIAILWVLYTRFQDMIVAKADQASYLLAAEEL